MTAPATDITPSEQVAAARAATFDMEDRIRRIDRGARAVLAMATGHQPEHTILDYRAIYYVGETLAEQTDALLQEWDALSEILKPAN